MPNEKLRFDRSFSYVRSVFFKIVFRRQRASIRFRYRLHRQNQKMSKRGEREERIIATPALDILILKTICLRIVSACGKIYKIYPLHSCEEGITPTRKA